MNIGIDARFLLRPQRGMPHYVTQICRHMPALRPDGRFTLFINRAYEHNEAAAEYEERLEGVGAHANVAIVNMDDDAEVRWEQVLLPRAVKERGVDLLHMPGNRTCFRAGVPVVPTVHDVMELRHLRREQAAPRGAGLRARAYFWRRRAYVWATYRLGFPRAAAIVTVSDSSKRELVDQLGISSDRVHTIHHGIEAHFRPLDGLETLATRTHSLMFGGDSYHKNPEGALRAWSNVPEDLRRRFPLKIIGFRRKQSSRLMNALEELGLQTQVSVSEWVDSEALVHAMQRAAILLFLSRGEGFGFPIVEAMACGTPVASSNIDALTEIAGGAAAVTVAPDDAASAAAGITRVLSSPEEWSRAAGKGLRRATAFSWAESAEKHLQVYERVLNPRRART